jgi:hypothetical protein
VCASSQKNDYRIYPHYNHLHSIPWWSSFIDTQGCPAYAPMSQKGVLIKKIVYFQIMDMRAYQTEVNND